MDFIDKAIEMIINGTKKIVEGHNVSIVNDKVFVNGKLVAEGLTGTVHIEWNGPAANIDCTSITVNGNVEGNIDATSVRCGDVGGDVDAKIIARKVGSHMEFWINPMYSTMVVD